MRIWFPCKFQEQFFSIYSQTPYNNRECLRTPTNVKYEHCKLAANCICKLIRNHICVGIYIGVRAALLVPLWITIGFENIYIYFIDFKILYSLEFLWLCNIAEKTFSDKGYLAYHGMLLILWCELELFRKVCHSYTTYPSHFPAKKNLKCLFLPKNISYYMLF